MEETEKLLKAYFDGFPGLLEDFEAAKNEATKKGWITICSYTDKRYFYPHYKEMKALKTKAYSLTKYNEGEKIPIEEKERLRNETDWTKLWRKFMALKGSLERKALNYRIQGLAATQSKLSGILFYKNRTNESQEIFNFIHDKLFCCV